MQNMGTQTGSSGQTNQTMQQCIQECLTCHTVCLETISQCLQMGGKHSDAKHIGLLSDCAQICMGSADFMIRMSQFHGQICGVCAAICEACAASCEQLADGSDFMARCAESCRRCAESCGNMASSM